MVKKAILILCIGIYTVTAFAQRQVSDKNAMVLRMERVQVTNKKMLDDRDRLLREGNSTLANKITMFEDILYKKLWNIVGESKRFEITDSAYAAKLDAEQRSPEALAAKKANPHLFEKKMMQKQIADAIFAVDWTLQCDITECLMMSKGNYGWICTLHITPRIQDRRTETMRLVDSRLFVNKVSQTKIRPTPEGAFSAAVDAMHDDLVRYFTENFPVYGKVMKLDEKNNAVVNCGVKYNLQKGDVFQVTHMIPQKNSEDKYYFVEQVIGTLKVKQVLDESCVCDLLSGEDKIIDANNVGGFLQCKQIMK